ncbi:MAG: trehalose-phosphatase [Alphaproteobacteria bacterium]|nr:trehalose-phosphatase [Alphaproteobacteria bacterium]
MSAAPDSQVLPYPPLNLLESASLFLDFDGTLVDIADRPDAVVVDQALNSLLADLARRHDNCIALISGRSIAQLDALIGPIARNIALSGSHGSEYRWNGTLAHPVRPASLEQVERVMRDAATGHPGSLVETKSFGVALHYRLAPEFESEARALAARLAGQFDLALQEGKMMVELRVPGSDKGVAVTTMMRRREMAGTRPVFIGDDVTDEDGFEAARTFGGTGILVGPPRETAASYRLPDPAAVRHWLAGESQ